MTAEPDGHDGNLEDPGEELSQLDAGRTMLVSMRIPHHADKSGYHRLAETLDARAITAAAEATLAGRITGRLLGPLVSRSRSCWYHRPQLLAELSAARHWITARRNVFHFLYGEHSFRYLGALKRLMPRRNAIVVTYHTPIWRMKELLGDTAHIGRADAIIVMASTQRAFFSDLVGPERVHFVPHGVDTGFFAPLPKRSGDGPFRLISVGRHLRDFDALEAVAREFAARRRDVEFLVVSQPEQLARFSGLPNVLCRSNVGDRDLLDLYRSADALFLPLIDATANNALLEGIACGLPVISTDLQAVRDYVGVDSGGALLVPKGDVSALCESIRTLMDDGALRQAMGERSREAALRLDWARVAADTVRVYREALERL